MEKINLPFFYVLGYKLNLLTQLNADEYSKIFIGYSAMDVRRELETLFVSFPMLSVSRSAGNDLIGSINELGSGPVPDALNEKPGPKETVYRNIIKKAKDLEIVLLAELQNVAGYYVTQKGIYDTTGLIERADQTLPPDVVDKLNSKAVEELRQAGKCLAFDIPTASGFHSIRAAEAVLHDYYLAVCKAKSKQPLDNWGAYISELHKVNTTDGKQSDVKEVEALLQQIKDQHRNLIMHPEIVLSPNDAFTLFEIVQGAIIAMASRLKSRKIIHAAKQKKALAPA